jgi:hypothetical protein
MKKASHLEKDGGAFFLVDGLTGKGGIKIQPVSRHKDRGGCKRLMHKTHVVSYAVSG